MELSPACSVQRDKDPVSVLRSFLLIGQLHQKLFSYWKICILYEVTIGGCWPSRGWCLRTSEASEAKWGWFGRVRGRQWCVLAVGCCQNDHSLSSLLSSPGTNSWHQASLTQLQQWKVRQHFHTAWNLIIAFANMMQIRKYDHNLLYQRKEWQHTALFWWSPLTRIPRIVTYFCDKKYFEKYLNNPKQYESKVAKKVP